METIPTIEHLFRKPVRKSPMVAVEELELIGGYGIEGDVNANSNSPRQVLVIDRANLNNLSIPPGELRENIILDGVNLGQLQPGAKLTFPSGAAIRLTFYCEPCKRVARWVDSLKQMEQKRGILGIVVRGGAIAMGERFKLQADYFPACSEIPYERYLKFIGQIPVGKVVTYRQILEAIGVDRSYFRVLPLYLRKTPPGYPRHRILNSQGQTVSHIPQQRALLAAEGIELTGDGGGICLKQYAWHHAKLCLEI